VSFLGFAFIKYAEGSSGMPREMRQLIRRARGIRSSQTANGAVRGYTLIQLVIVIAITMTMMAISVPLMTSALNYFKFRSAVSSIAGAIQSGRNQAIFQGCPYQTVFNAGNKTYQTQGQSPDATNTCVAPFACPGGAAACAVPFAGPGPNVILDADQTLTFSPGGTMASATAVNGVTTMVVSYPNGNRTATIRISRFGNINVTYQ
jgi:Tfp pilus assembly protein FimT